MSVDARHASGRSRRERSCLIAGRSDRLACSPSAAPGQNLLLKPKNQSPLPGLGNLKYSGRVRVASAVVVVVGTTKRERRATQKSHNYKASLPFSNFFVFFRWTSPRVCVAFARKKRDKQRKKEIQISLFDGDGVKPNIDLLRPLTNGARFSDGKL